MGNTTRRLARGGALLTTAALLAVSAGPALAADPVAQASATALRLSLGGTPTDSGTYTVTNDGERETTTGSNEPAISALGGQSFIQAGTLSQDADTVIRNRDGFSAACAGLAGDGATLVEVAEGGCLVPGENLALDAGTADLTGIRILGDQFPQELQDALQPVLDPLLAGLSDALEAVLDGGDLALGLDLGAVQSFCTAQPGSAAGDTDITDASLFATLGGTRIDVVELPTNPPPNTKVITDLGVVVQSVLDALSVQFETAIDGALDPVLGVVVDEAAVLAEALEQVGEQLAPLEENILDITLNKQERPSNDSIIVTALDLNLLPAAETAGFELLSAQIGESACGPNSRVGANPDPDPNPNPTPQPVPTSVPAGVESAGPGDDGLGTGGNLALLALVALSAGAGVASYRRSLRA